MNTDNNTPNNLYEHDPRLTAYALGEMDAADRAAYEAEIRDNPAAQSAIAEIRAMSAQLETALAHEPAPEAAPEPDWRAAREAEARARRAADPYTRKTFRFPYFIVAGLGLACFALIFFLADKNQRLERQLAQANRVVIDGKTYEPFDLGSVAESTVATTTAPAPALASVAVVTATNNVATSSLSHVPQLALADATTPPVNFDGGLHAVAVSVLKHLGRDRSDDLLRESGF